MDKLAFKDCAARKKLIQEDWHFDCKCSVCTLTGEELENNDVKRNVFMQLVLQFNDAAGRDVDADKAAELLAFAKDTTEIMNRISLCPMMMSMFRMAEASCLFLLGKHEESRIAAKESVLYLWKVLLLITIITKNM